MKKIELNADAFLIEDFLTKEECSYFIEKSIKQGFEESKVNIGGEQIMNKDVRNNDRLFFFDEMLADLLWDKLKGFMPKKIGKFKPFGMNEMFRVYRYEKGQVFKRHRDGNYHRNAEEVSFYSFLIYLNENFEGGATGFSDFGEVVPKTGAALIFNHGLIHEGKVIESGLKYVLRTDVMCKWLG